MTCLKTLPFAKAFIRRVSLQMLSVFII
jgi:hypothetical protein